MSYIYIDTDLIKAIRKHVAINGDEMVIISLVLSYSKARKKTYLTTKGISTILGKSPRRTGDFLDRLQGKDMVSIVYNKNSQPEMTPSLKLLGIVSEYEKALARKEAKGADKVSKGPLTKCLGDPISKGIGGRPLSPIETQEDTSWCPPAFQKKYKEYLDHFGTDYAKKMLQRFNDETDELL